MVTPKTIDEYLAPLSDEKRAALEKLRRAIRSAAPKAEECISYQIPSFRLGGRVFVPGVPGTKRLLDPFPRFLPPPLTPYVVTFPPDRPLGYEDLIPIVESA